jgi:sulfite exporter TauE/SafE
MLGALGIVLGSSLAGLVRIETIRGDIAGWLMLTLGLVYLAWGLKQAARNEVHAHAHVHADGTVHNHRHDHRAAHLHPHRRGAGRFAPWALFIVFVLGPCEALIPLLMYPASQHNYAAVGLVAAVFAAATLATMTALVALGCLGAKRLPLGGMDRYVHALAGAAISLCAAGMLVGL